MRKKLTTKQASGFSLIEVLISMGLVSILSLVVFSLNNFMNRGKVSSETAFAADSFRKEILGMLNNSSAWRQTLLNNPTFNCIKTATDCSAVVATNAINNGPPTLNDTSYANFANATGPCAAGVCNGGFDVYNAKTPASVFYAGQAQPQLGFQNNGAQCAPNVANGSPAPGALGWLGVKSGNTYIGSGPMASKCPFRMVLYWVPICATSTTCIAPSIRVKGYTLYAPSPGDTTGLTAFNPANYGIDVILPPKYQ